MSSVVDLPLSSLLDMLKTVESSSASTDSYVKFFVDVGQVLVQPENRAVLSEIGSKTSWMYTAGVGTLYKAGVLNQGSDVGETPEAQKARWLDLAHSLNLTYAGLLAAKSATDIFPISDTSVVDPSLNLLTFADFKSFGKVMNLPIASAFAYHHYFNVLAEYPFVEAIVKTAPEGVLQTTAEKVMHTASFMTSGTSLLKYGAYLGGFSTLSTTLGVVAATIGSVRFFASQQVKSEKRSPLVILKRDLLKVIDEMYEESIQRLGAKSYGVKVSKDIHKLEQNSDETQSPKKPKKIGKGRRRSSIVKADMDHLKKICDICREKVRASNDDKELCLGLVVTGNVMACLGSNRLIEKKLGERFQILNKTCEDAVSSRQIQVREGREKIAIHREFLQTQKAILVRALEDCEEGVSFGDSIARYKEDEIRETMARVEAEMDRIAALSEPSQTSGLVITSWLDEVAYLCSDKHRERVQEWVAACQEEPSFTDLVRL